MKKGILTSLGLAAVLTLGLASVNEYRDFKEVDAETSYYKLVTSAPTDWAGDYLIVSTNQDGVKVAFNGGLSTLDAAGNTINVDITDNKIKSNETTDAATFSIESISGGFALKNKSGLYIGQSTYGNGLKTATSASYVHTLSIDESNNAIISCATSGGSVTLKYNYAKDQLRFRYYKSGQQEIQLYKLETSGGETPEPEQPDTPVDYDEELVPLFNEYFITKEYTKHTKINLKTDDSVKSDLAKYFHTSNFPTLERNTYYKDNALWMQNGTNYSYYGTKDGNMTSGRVANIGDTVDTLSVVGTSMEDYYVTLDDFVKGEHQSVHSNNNKLNLKENWTKEGNAYTSTSEDVFDAFRLFTAPLWIGKTTENANYIPFTKATVEKVNNTLVMSLYVDSTEYSKEGGKITDASGLFSQATIKKGVLNKITTTTDALAGFVGEKVNLENVTVKSIYGEWSEGYQNMSFYVTDGTADVLVFRTGTRVYVGDVVDVSGEISIYNGTAQIAQGATTTVVTRHTCSYSEATCKDPATCSICGATTGTTTDNHNYVSGVCTVCGGVDPDYEGEVTYEAVETALELGFEGAANKANGDTYLTTNFPNWTITGKLGQTYAGYLGFGRSGDATSAITSGRFTATSDFTVTAVLKGNGASGVATSTVKFELLDASENVVATGYASGSSTITPADAEDTTYTITFTYVDGKTYADAAHLKISFSKATGNIGLKTLSAAY